MQEAAQISSDAFIRIEAEHPVELQLRARSLEQQAPVPALGQPARFDILLPSPVCDDGRHLRMSAQDIQRPVGAGVIVGDDRIHLLSDIVEGVAQHERLVAHAGHPDHQVLLIQQRSVARNDALAIAQLPIAGARFAHGPPL